MLMKRRVVKHGPSTLIISLPSKWTKEYGVDAGNELDVCESGSTLKISTDSRKTPESVTVDVTGIDRTSIIQLIRNLYRRGYGEIVIKFSEPTTKHFRTGQTVSIVSVINEESRRLIGMEIISQKHNYCIMKEITESSGKEFNSVVRKIALQIEDSLEDLITNLSNNDFTALADIEEKHDMVAKFASYCIRLINQGKIQDVENSFQLYQILTNYDLIMDILKYFSRSLIATKHTLKKQGINTLKDILDVFRLYEKVQFDYKKENLMAFQKERDILKKDINKKLSSASDDFAYVSYTESLLEIMKMMTETVLSAKD